jgi:hypothetical protein
MSVKRYRYGVATGLGAGHIDIRYGDDYLVTVVPHPPAEERVATIVKALNDYAAAIAERDILRAEVDRLQSKYHERCCVGGM